MYAADVGEPRGVKLPSFGMRFDVTFPLIRKEKEQSASAGESAWRTDQQPFPTEATFPENVRYVFLGPFGFCQR